MTDDVSGESPKDVLLPEDNLDSRSITWPTVLGAISIVYSVLGVFSNTCGTASIFLGDAGLKLAGVEVEGGLGFPAWITISTIISGGVGLILAVLLFAGGVGLIRRWPGSLPLLKFWVVASILATVIQIVLGFFAINNNTDLQIRIQDATVDMLRKQNPEISSGDLAAMGLSKSESEIRSESTRNTLVFGGIPVIYPIVLGFLLTSKGRVRQVEGWE